MDELYLENIDELVTDQNKIVTYKWLSHTLGVHVNQAKQMLYDYVTRKRKENLSAQVHVTYLVTGKCIQNGYPFHKVAVVKEEKLEATKAKLAVVANVHVYSIQKAMLKDSGPLFNTDYDILKSNLQNCNKFSAIQCPEAVPRSAEEMSRLRKTNDKETEDVQMITKPTINGHSAAPIAKAVVQQPKGIMGMFSRQPAKATESQKETKVEPKESAATATSSKPSGKTNTVNNFFGKASLNKIKESSSSSVAVKEEKPATQPPITQSDPIPEVPPQEKTVKQSEPAKSPVKEKKRTKRTELFDSDEEEKTVKKRRRIRQPQPDSSDDEATPASCEVKTPSPPPPPSPPTPEPVLKVEAEPKPQPLPEGKRRKRRRVLKSRMFLDEDNCMVTEKNYVSESCTDSEEDFAKSKAAPKQSNAGVTKQETKAEAKAAKKGAAVNKGTKQASIMGFFQKK